MTSKEAISKLNKFRNNYYNDIDEEKREIAQALNIVLPQFEELKHDVKRYFDLYLSGLISSNETVKLLQKLSKVGKEDV